jgi:hypothetical protein
VRLLHLKAGPTALFAGDRTSISINTVFACFYFNRGFKLVLMAYMIDLGVIPGCMSAGLAWVQLLSPLLGLPPLNPCRKVVSSPFNLRSGILLAHTWAVQTGIGCLSRLSSFLASPA